MKNCKQQTFNLRTVIGIFAIIVLAFTVNACKEDDGDDGAGSGNWLITKSTSYTVTDGTVGNVSSSTDYYWINYSYSNETNYEEEYTTETSDSITYYHYIRNRQNGESEPLTAGGKSASTYIYDLESGLTKSLMSTNTSGVITGTSYVIEFIGNIDGVKTYKYYPINSAGSYYLYKIQNGGTLETRYYDADGVLVYTSANSQPDNAAIRAKSPNFTLYSYYYSNSSNSSSQMAEVISETDSELVIRVKTFNNSLLSSQTDYRYKKINPNGNGGSNSSDFDYIESGNSIIITGYKGAGGRLTIPAKINGKTVIGIGIGGEEAFKDCKRLFSITIPNIKEFALFT